VNHVVRIFNTNLDGMRTVLYGLTGIKGVGRRFGDAVIKRSGVDGTKRIGELTAEEIEKLVQVIEKPLDYDIPVWMLNRRKDYATGKDLHNNTNKWDFQVKTDIERLIKMRAHRGLRHAWGYKVGPCPPRYRLASEAVRAQASQRASCDAATPARCYAVCQHGCARRPLFLLACCAMPAVLGRQAAKRSIISRMQR
jgi:small subunit ribosomal protein S18e